MTTGNMTPATRQAHTTDIAKELYYAYREAADRLGTGYIKNQPPNPHWTFLTPRQRDVFVQTVQTLMEKGVI